MGVKNMSDDDKAVTDKLRLLEERIGKLETQNREMEFRIQKLSDIMLTADKMHQKMRSETIRHDF
jgi:uncharacterized coiled-coil protein SlyX